MSCNSVIKLRSYICTQCTRTHTHTRTHTFSPLYTIKQTLVLHTDRSQIGGCRVQVSHAENQFVLC